VCGHRRYKSSLHERQGYCPGPCLSLSVCLFSQLPQAAKVCSCLLCAWSGARSSPLAALLHVLVQLSGRVRLVNACRSALLHGQPPHRAPSASVSAPRSTTVLVSARAHHCCPLSKSKHVRPVHFYAPMQLVVRSTVFSPQVASSVSSAIPNEPEHSPAGALVVRPSQCPRDHIHLRSTAGYTRRGQLCPNGH
jgi:hypothetical protein